MQCIVPVFCLCVCVCVLLLCLQVIVLDKRACGQGWTGRCPVPAFLCLLLNNEVNNPDPSLAHFCPRSCSPTPQLGSTWGLPPLPLCPASQWDMTPTNRPRFFTNIHYQKCLPMGNPTGNLENGGLLRVGWKSPPHRDINVNYLWPSALGVPERLQRAQV